MRRIHDYTSDFQEERTIANNSEKCFLHHLQITWEFTLDSVRFHKSLGFSPIELTDFLQGAWEQNLN